MTETDTPLLSVTTLFAEREERRRREHEAEEQLQKKHQEDLEGFRKRLDEFQVTDDRVHAMAHRIKEAFDRGENELMLTSFPSSFCTDGGRAVNNADLPPINKPAALPNPSLPPEPAWLATLPRGIHAIYDHWKQHLRPGGFHFSVRVISYPGGKPGDVGVFLSWPKTAPDRPA